MRILLVWFQGPLEAEYQKSCLVEALCLCDLWGLYYGQWRSCSCAATIFLERQPQVKEAASQGSRRGLSLAFMAAQGYVGAVQESTSLTKFNLLRLFPTVQFKRCNGKEELLTPILQLKCSVHARKMNVNIGAA